VSRPAVAQTAPQLWAQLASAGLPTSEIEQLHRVYAVSARLFTGRSRECGKPFIDHLVGTASAAALTRPDPAVIGAALLHAAYTHNVFDDLGRSATRRRRRSLRRLVGPEIEILVYRYTVERWDFDRVRALTSEAPDPTERDLLVLRVANEIDEHLDGAMRFDPKRTDPLHDPPGTAAHAALARHYHLDVLAALLEEVTAEAAALPEPPTALLSEPGDHHIALPPWARPTLRRRIRNVLGRVHRRIHA